MKAARKASAGKASADRDLTGARALTKPASRETEGRKKSDSFNRRVMSGRAPRSRNIDESIRSVKSAAAEFTRSAAGNSEQKE
jgi:hypothetical protein